MWWSATSSTDEVVAQIREAYAKAKAKPMPPVVLPEEPKQTAPREIIEEAPIELGHMHMSWHIPELRHADIPVLDVLAVVLGSGRSSRLYQQLREKQGLVQFRLTPGLTIPAIRGCSASACWWTRTNSPPARDAALAEVERVKNEGDLAGGSHARPSNNLSPPRSPRARPCRARRRTWAEAGWRPMI